MTGTLRTPAHLPSVIETDRLALRPWRAEDADELHGALVESVDHLDPWVPWASSKPTTLDQARELLEGWIRDFEDGQSHIFAVFDRSDSVLTGGIGLYPRIGPGALEIGYWIRRTRIGRGFATEASRAISRLGFQYSGVARLEMHVDPANLASCRIPEKLGYRRVETRQADRDGSKQTTVFVLDLDELRLPRSRSHHDGEAR